MTCLFGNGCVIFCPDMCYCAFTIKVLKLYNIIDFLKRREYMKKQMKKQMKKMLSMILALAMILTLTNGYHSKVVKAAVKTQGTTYNGNNIGAQDYTGKQSNYYPGPMKSYLVAQKDGTFMRVHYGSQIEGL